MKPTNELISAYVFYVWKIILNDINTLLKSINLLAHFGSLINILNKKD